MEWSLGHTFPSAELIFPPPVLEYFCGVPLLSVTITNSNEVPFISDNRFIFVSIYIADCRCKIKLA